MKTPIRFRLPIHYISDHSERKGNSGECDDRTKLPATLGQAVNTKKFGEYLICANGSINLNIN